MGLFFSFRTDADHRSAAAIASTEDLARAVLSLPVLALGADGQITDMEIDRLLTVCARHPLMQAVGPSRCLALAEGVAAAIRTEGAGTVFMSAARELSPRGAETALYLAVCCLRDYGPLDADHEAMLFAMGRGLNLSHADTGAILDSRDGRHLRAA